MKTFLLATGFLAAMATAAGADVSKEDLRKLAQAGIGDDTILAFVKSHGPVAPLSSDDLAELKKSGLSDKVLKTLASSPAGVPPVPASAAGTEKSPTVTSPQPTTTYMYEGPDSYYYPYSDYPGYYPYYYSYPGFYPSFGFNFRFGPRARFFAPFHSRGGFIRRR
jgi:hypothetical protein